MYFSKLGEYLTYFRGRTATPVDVYGPQVADSDEAWSKIRSGLGLSRPVGEGEKVRLSPDGLAPMDGVIDWASPETLGVRTADGMYRFIHGLEGTVVLGHHIFSDEDGAEKAWQGWVERVFG